MPSLEGRELHPSETTGRQATSDRIHSLNTNVPGGLGEGERVQCGQGASTKQEHRTARENLENPAEARA